MRADSHELWFAAILVALWAFESFHHPYTRAAIRYATTWRRYSIGLTVFTLAALGQFALLTLLVNTVQTQLFRLVGLGVDPLWWAGVDALISALLLVVLSPIFPLARELRHITWLLAGFPRLAQVVAGDLRFGGDDGKAHDALQRSLADFETCCDDVGSLLSERILATLIEIQ
jgi:hypothetical protein